MPSFDLEPKQWEQKEPFKITDKFLGESWIFELGYPLIGMGLKSKITALESGVLQIADAEGNLTTKSLEKASQLNSDQALQEELIQASLEGRLFLKHPETGELRQLQAEVNGTKTSFIMNLSRPLDRVPWAPEPILEKPERPGLWTRFVAFLFKNSAAAETVRAYETALAAYNAQQERLNPKPEAEQVQQPQQAETQQAETQQVRQREPVDEKARQKNISQLEQDYEKGLEINITDPGHKTQFLLGYTTCQNMYMAGLDARLNLIRKPDEHKGTDREEHLTAVLIGEMVNRGINGEGKTTGDVKKFVENMASNPDAINDSWWEQLGNNPAIKELAKADNETLINTLSNPIKFTQWANQALIQSQKVKASGEAEGSEIEKKGNEMEGKEMGDKPPEAPAVAAP